MSSEDPTSQGRKKDHIDLALKSAVAAANNDDRFLYEPIMSGNVVGEHSLSIQFLGKSMRFPIWISSMTGGTEMAGTINRNLAKVCRNFGLGMGLGSCRSLLYDDTFLSDFTMRSEIGDQPFYANLGIAQLEELVNRNQIQKIKDLISKLDADGLIVHVNPLQEWLQAEGDRYCEAPIITIEKLCEKLGHKIIVKEVGHGMGATSIKALMELPIEAIEFAAFGGTNFSKIELSRNVDLKSEVYEALTYVGHTAEEMITFVNSTLHNNSKVLCNQIIISGGVKNFLDGYYFINKCKLPSVYGQASGFLKYAMEDYDKLHQFVSYQVDGLALATQLLKVK